jgi:Cu/Ag efflux pump CusA
VLYRGLGAVIVGGMTVSTIFTLLLLPALLRLGEREAGESEDLPHRRPTRPALERVA